MLQQLLGKPAPRVQPYFPNPLSYNLGLFYSQWHYGQSFVRGVGGPGSCFPASPIAGPFSLGDWSLFSFFNHYRVGLNTPYLCVMAYALSPPSITAVYSLSNAISWLSLVWALRVGVTCRKGQYGRFGHCSQTSP